MPDGAADLGADLYRRMPEARVTDILLEVDRRHLVHRGGFTDHVFAACSILGYAFVPRIRDFRPLPQTTRHWDATTPARRRPSGKASRRR